MTFADWMSAGSGYIKFLRQVENKFFSEYDP